MATQAQINGGLRGLNTGHSFEAKVRSKKNGWFPTTMLDIWGERKTRCKTDVVTKYHNYSIKNSQTSTQIQVCSVDRFSRLFNIDSHLKPQFDQFFGNHGYFKDQKLFREHCEKIWGIDTKNLSEENEIRRNRVLGSNLTNSQSMVDWFQENIRPVLEFLFKTSFNNPVNTETIANRVLWTKEKDCYESRCEFDIDPLIDKIAEKAIVKIRPNGSVIEIGPVTLQMKGSGKSASAYHNMQFNASLKDIEKWI